MEAIQLEVTASQSDIRLTSSDGTLLARLGLNTDGELVAFIPDAWYADSDEDFTATADGTIDASLSTEVTERDRVLYLIRKSFKENPTQSKAEVSRISRDIARQVYGSATRKNIMRVAGFRAAHTRGAYDN